ncbi:MAG: hypothetical protein IKP31_02355 [Lachnospiraceae bacterium]|nr:hypothetical protein [Lachnospiraceae bacterium]
MEELKYTMTLADGTQLKNLTLNGNNYISKTSLKESDFEGKLQTVTISDGENTQVLHNCDLDQLSKVGKEYWFVINERSAEAQMLLEMQANIDFIAAMTDVPL